MNSIQDFLKAREALVQERANLVKRIADIEKVLGSPDKAVARPSAPKPAAKKAKAAKSAKTATGKPKRTMSAEARAKISAAATKRWAKIRRNKKA